MRTFQQQRNYEKLEQLPPQIGELARLKLWWLGQAFRDFWHSPSGEPQVRQKTDRFGNLYWRVYDPVSDRTVRFDNQQQVLIWLDERHYRRVRSNAWNMG